MSEKYSTSKEWFRSRAHMEEGQEIGAGSEVAAPAGSVNIPWYCPTCQTAGELTLCRETTIGQILNAIQCLHSPVCSGVAGIGYMPCPPNAEVRQGE